MTASRLGACRARRPGRGSVVGRSWVAAMRPRGYEGGARISCIAASACAGGRTWSLVPVELHRVPLPGTRATTLLLAFDAGARTERPEENGMAHFLEHLVFKGGEKYADHRAVNETAERMGGVLNAYTSHDLVAFHITVRAEAADEALDLLTDFVGRPHIDAGELDRERGVVIQEINRSKDQPSVVAEHLIDHAAFGDAPARPPGARPRGAPADVHPRGDRRLPRAPLARGAALRRRQPRAPRRRSASTDLLDRLPGPTASSLRARAGARDRPRRRGARHQPVAPADALPPADRPHRPGASARR